MQLICIDTLASACDKDLTCRLQALKPHTTCTLRGSVTLSLSLALSTVPFDHLHHPHLYCPSPSPGPANWPPQVLSSAVKAAPKNPTDLPPANVPAYDQCPRVPPHDHPCSSRASIQVIWLTKSSTSTSLHCVRLEQRRTYMKTLCVHKVWNLKSSKKKWKKNELKFPGSTVLNGL